MIEISELTRVKVLNKTMETYGQIKGGIMLKWFVSRIGLSWNEY